MIIGLCTIIAVEEMSVITYALETYELALAQAIELQKGVTSSRERIPEKLQENGLRQTVWKFPFEKELIIVQEIEVGKLVLECIKL